MERSWEVHDYFATLAVVGLGARQLIDDDSWRISGQPALKVRRSGYGMIYGYAENDGVPVEVARSSGEVVGARVEYVDDVADLEAAGEGRWERLGILRIGPAGAVARGLEGSDEVRISVPLPAGRYAAESFSTEEDYLGIRLVALIGDERHEN